MSNASTEKIVYLLRHGQSVHNVAPVFQSEQAILSDIGLQQAETLAARIVKLNFDTLITSVLPRAQQTTQPIAQATGKTPELSELFVERKKPTAIDGKPYTDAEANKIWRAWEESLYTSGMRVADGESFDDIMQRADRALAFLANRPENSLVVVTHGYFLRTMVARVLLGNELSDKAFGNFQRAALVENTGITVLKYQSAFEEPAAWRLWIYNDHAHVAD